MRLDFDHLVTVGRRRQRRRRAGIVAGVAAAACALVTIGAGWYADRGDEGTIAPPASNGPEHGPETTEASAGPTAPDAPTAPEDMPAFLRSIVARNYGQDTEQVGLWGATWSDFHVADELEDPLLSQPHVPDDAADAASEWHYRLRPTPTTIVRLDVGYLPPDLPKGYYAMTCLPDEVRYDHCTDGEAAGGRAWKQLIQVNGGDPGGGPTSARTLTVLDHGFVVQLREERAADVSGGAWLISDPASRGACPGSWPGVRPPG